MNFHATNEFRCPFCESILDTAAAFSHNDKPKNDDISICIECAELSIYVIKEGIISLRKPTEKDIDDIKQSGQWPEIEGTIDFIKSKPKK